MADKFKIVHLKNVGEEYEYGTVVKIATKEEYIEEIAEILWKKHFKVYRMDYKYALTIKDSLISCAMDTIQELAKAVADKLFGEDKK